jgi:hypothetical protein
MADQRTRLQNRSLLTHYTASNNPEERRSDLFRGGNLNRVTERRFATGSTFVHRVQMGYRITSLPIQQEMMERLTLIHNAMSHPCRAHAAPIIFPCRSLAMSHRVNSHMPCRAPAILRQCRVHRESPHGSRKYPNR